eukprot:6174150-Pleurochrysis_carterae.AAC.8
MSIFAELEHELPPLAEYANYIFASKAMELARFSVREYQFAPLRAELFSPKLEANKETTEQCIELAVVAAEAWNHAKSSCAILRRQLRGTSRARAASYHGATPRPPSSLISAALASALTQFHVHCLVATARRNNDLSNGALPTEKREGKGNWHRGARYIFGLLSVKSCKSLITKAGRDYEEEVVFNNKTDLTEHREARCGREELAREAGIAKLSEAYIDALYYFEKWSSSACWKTKTQADAELAKLKSRSTKIAKLKEQVRIRVLGLRAWANCAIAWSKSGKERTVAELLVRLKSIILQQRTRAIPAKSALLAFERKRLPSLGKCTADVASLVARK